MNIAHCFQDIVCIENTTKEKIKQSNLHCLAAFRTANVSINITNLAKLLCPGSHGSWVSYVLVLTIQPLGATEAKTNARYILNILIHKYVPLKLLNIQ